MFFRNSVVMISSYHAKRDSSVIRQFDSRYIQEFGSLPSLYSYLGYDVAVMFGEGMYKAIEYDMYDKNYTQLQTTYKF